MAKKGQIINHYHIEELEVETKIDYKKLAKEIVAAQEEAKRLSNRYIGARAAVMRAFNVMLSVFLGIFAILFGVAIWSEFEGGSVQSWVDCITYTVMLIGVILVSACCGLESWRDDDENTVTHFNTNVALVALIVSLVALKG